MSSSNTLKFSERTSSEAQFPPRSKLKFFQVLSDLAEEDEYRTPSPSIDSKRPAMSIPAGASKHCPVDITDIDEASFSQPPRRAPRPPAQRVEQDERSEDVLSISDLSLEFPSPPVTLTRSPATKLLPMRFRRPSHSPTSSISSSSTSFSTNASSQLIPTPATSDEDIPSSVTSVNSKRPSVLFTKSLPDLHQESMQRLIQPHSLVSTSDDDSSVAESQLESESEDDEEDSEWITQAMKDFITLQSLSTDSSDSSSENSAARPESFLPPVRTSRRYSKTICSSVGPSAQLDPTFPSSRRKQHIYFPAPSCPPPPPPTCAPSLPPVSPLCTTSTSASQSIPLVSAPTYLNRPPPRVSVPMDVDELMQMDLNDFDFLEDDLKEDLLNSPFSPTYSDYHLSPTFIGFEHDDFRARLPSSIGHTLPDSPSARTHERDSSIHHQTPSASFSSSSTRPHLRSRWSTSTLSSISNQQTPASSWMSKLTLRTKKSKTPPVPSISSAQVTKPVKKEKHRKFTGPDLLRDRLDKPERRIDRRDSRSSRTSSDSAESTSSVGLKRKPIPVEIFMKA